VRTAFLLRPAIRRWWPPALLTAAWIVWLLWLPPRPSAWLILLVGLLPLAAWMRALARDAGTTWAGYVRAHPGACGLAAVLLYAVGVQMADTHGVTTDGAIYFSQLRSAVFDRDLDVAAEFAALGQPPRPSHFVPIGPALFWLPLYLVVAVIDGAGRMLGLAPTPDDPVRIGLTLPYVRAALLTSFALGALGLAAVHALVRRDHGRLAAFLATLLVFAATPLVWYMVYEPAMTHAASFGTVAVLVLAAVRWRGPDGYAPRDARRLGALAAIAFLMRPQEALFAAVPATLAAATWPTWPARTRGLARLAAAAAVGAAPWLALQALHSVVLMRANDFQLFGQQGYLDPWRSRWLDTLFSSWHGLLSWTPVVYVAVLGTIALAVRRRPWGVLALALLAAMAWVNGATADWAGGWSFGGRRFTSTLVVLAPGLALAIDAARRRPQVLLAAVAVLAVVWNYGLMVQYTAGMVPKDGPVSFGRVVRQQAELATRPPFFYPFAFPANAWFAWREGLPVDRYDVLAAEPLTGDVAIEFVSRADRFLLAGWDAPGGDEWGAHWWLNDSPAVMVVPLDPAPKAPVEIQITARTRFEEPAVEARLELRVNGRPVGQFVAPPTEAGTARLTVPVTPGLWRRGFNRIAIASLGVTRVDPSDARPPGPMAARLGDRPWPVAVYHLRIRSLG
jgi:hypothetical protein